MREATRRRVEEAIAATGWTVNPTARLLAGGKGDEVAVVVAVADSHDAVEDPYYARVLAGSSEEATRHGLSVSVHFAAGGPVHELVPFSGDRRYVGAILVNVGAPAAAHLVGRGTPIVSLGASAAGVPSLDPDNRSGAASAVEHLLANGRRKIAAVAGPWSNPCARERSIGYRSAVASAGSAPFEVATDFTRAGAADAIDRLLDSHPDLDAVFVASDLMATAVLQVLTERGRRTPDDVAVVGFDDSWPARMTTPALTTVRQPVEDLAGRAVLTLLEQPHERLAFQRLPVELVVRRSSVA